MRFIAIAMTLCVGATLGQHQQQQQYHPTTTPVPILKQINRHNEDGSYSYGFEAADGSYKIESKYPTGEVHGKYGFIDDTGSLREIEYGASSKRGFEPQGTGINVPPPTVNGNSISDEKDDPNDDGSYREDPSIYYTDPRYTNGERYDPVPKRYNPIQNHQVYSNYNSPSKSVAAAYRQPAPAPAPAPVPAPAPAPIQYPYQPQPQAQPQYQPQYPQYQQYQQQRYVPQYQQPEYQPQFRTQYQGQYQQPAAAYSQPQYNYAQSRYAGHPNLAQASYSVNYKR